jgi:hypothetical protein
MLVGAKTEESRKSRQRNRGGTSEAMPRHSSLVNGHTFIEANRRRLGQGKICARRENSSALGSEKHQKSPINILFLKQTFV